MADRDSGSRACGCTGLRGICRATVKGRLTKEPEMIASVVLAALNGVARRALEAKSPEREVEQLREVRPRLFSPVYRPAWRPKPESRVAA